MNPGRRRWLQALGLGLAGSAAGLPRLGRGQTPRAPPIVEARLRRRWANGNSRLVPVTLITSSTPAVRIDGLPAVNPGRSFASRPDAARYSNPARSFASSAEGDTAAPTVGAGGSYANPPAASPATRLLFAGETTLGLVDPAEAEVLWQRPHALPGGAVFRPRAAAGTILAAGRGSLGTWRLADGEPRWRREASRQFGVPCQMEEAIFVGDGHELLALDHASGELRWRFAAVTDTQQLCPGGDPGPGPGGSRRWPPLRPRPS